MSGEMQKFIGLCKVLVMLGWHCRWIGLDQYIGVLIYLADTNTDISVSANWISLSVYWYQYRISTFSLVIGQISA